MRLTVLGSSASYADAGRACAGHLVRGGNAAVLLDCGNGVIANLASMMDPLDLDAVFVTHGHTDHFVDLYSLQAALRYAPDGPRPPMPLYVPSGLFDRMSAVLSDHGRTEFEEAFIVHVLEEGRPVDLNGLTVTPRPVDHVDPTFALVVEDGRSVLCYTSDTMIGEAVIDAARGADLLLAEATLPPAYRGRVPHMTPDEAARVAETAGVDTLVLTHLWPGVDREQAATEAREVFGGRVIVADELFDLSLA